MPKGSKLNNNNLAQSEFVEVKSKFDADFRRFSIHREKSNKFENFKRLANRVHNLEGIEFVIGYIDPQDGDLLPINNDDNFVKALTTALPLLRLIVQKKGESYGELNGYGAKSAGKGALYVRSQQFKQRGSGGEEPASTVSVASNRRISTPADFRRVSSIIDTDVVPVTQRRVQLMKSSEGRPLGFYIRDGSGVRCTMSGLVTVDAIFISRMVAGGLAEMTGLLAVNDEVLEVNGIDVCGKTIDQVSDMMVANSNNLIITVKPVNQRNNLGNTLPRKTWNNTSSLGYTPASGLQSIADQDPMDATEEDDDEVTTHITGP